MKLNKLLFFVPIILLVISCSGGSSGGGSETSTVTLSSITVTPANPGIALGTTEQFYCHRHLFRQHNKRYNTSATWSSDNTAVATIGTSSGSATAVANGTAKITATSGSISGYAILAVTSATLTSIEITPVTPSIYLGATQQFTATGTYSDGTISTTKDITTFATWSSDNTAIATISNTSGSNGLVMSLAAGMAIITAS